MKTQSLWERRGSTKGPMGCYVMAPGLSSLTCKVGILSGLRLVKPLHLPPVSFPEMPAAFTTHSGWREGCTCSFRSARVFLGAFAPKVKM